MCLKKKKENVIMHLRITPKLSHTAQTSQPVKFILTFTHSIGFNV